MRILSFLLHFLPNLERHAIILFFSFGFTLLMPKLYNLRKAVVINRWIFFRFVYSWWVFSSSLFPSNLETQYNNLVLQFHFIMVSFCLPQKRTGWSFSFCFVYFPRPLLHVLSVILLLMATTQSGGELKSLSLSLSVWSFQKWVLFLFSKEKKNVF